jgi:signal transduction histidine kinase
MIDEFDRPAQSFNEMLDRNQRLLEGLQQVSTDIAHDLRTPLIRLRQRLEAARHRARGVDAFETFLDGTVTEVDAILDIFGAARNGHAAVVEISDDGPGVPEAARTKVFQRFFRLEESRSTPGSGLGLSLVAAIAMLHRTTAELSDNGPGLRVRVLIAAQEA